MTSSVPAQARPDRSGAGALWQSNRKDEVDFEANANIDPAIIHTLATSDWVRKHRPLCLIGDSGTGKSHLLIALGIEAAMAGSSTPWPPSWSTSWSRRPMTTSALSRQ